jgi:hypothetical protein
MNGIWLEIGCLTASGLLLAGCNAHAPLESSFQGASFDTRGQVQEAVRLDRANSYLRAAERYDAVLHRELTPQQRASIQTAIAELYTRMCKAADDGDLEAKQTLATIEANRKAGY